MRKDIKFLLALSALWLGGVAVYSLIPRDHVIYEQIADKRIKSVVKRLNRVQNIDIAFFGSSRTMNGIDTDYLSRELKLDVYNFGCNWYGQDLWLSLIQQLLNKHKPKIVFVEAGFLRRYHGHVNFKNVAPMSDVVSTPIGKDYIHNLIYSVPRTTLQSIRLSFTKKEAFQDIENHGAVIQKLPSALVEPTKQKFANIIAQGPISAKRIEVQDGFKKKITDLRLSQQIRCYKEMKRLMKEGKLVILPLPKINISRMSDNKIKEWEEITDLLYLPPGMFDKPEYWRDEAHLNSEGAKVLAKYLKDYIKGILK